VNPTPRVFPVPENTEQCDSTSTNILIQSPSTFTSGSVSFILTATAPAGITGFTPYAPGLANGVVIEDILKNSTDAPLTVTYGLVPVSGTDCKNGLLVSFTVTVNPTPRATPVNIKPAICYDDLTEITLVSPTEMTQGQIKFDYTISYPTGITGNNASATDIPEDESLRFSYRNNNDTVRSVQFFITPKVEGLACPAGETVLEEVQLHPEPARGIEVIKAFTCESSSGRAALKAIISKGADPYKIVWTGPVGYYMEDSLEIRNLYAGNYILNVTDNLGCMDDTAYNIENLSANPRIILLPKSTGFHVTCPGGNDGVARLYVRDGGTPPFRYWLVYNESDTVYSGQFQNNHIPSDPSTYMICPDLRAGNYNFIIRDLNGCEVIRTATLSEPPPINVTINASNYNGANVSCRGYSDGFASATVTGGNGGYSYYWFPASGTLDVENTESLLDSIPAGKYYLNITDAFGCVKTDSVILTDPPGMELAASQVSESPDQDYEISCYGASDGYINLTITGGSGNYQYLWIGPGGFQATTEDINGLKAGLYTCTVTDINGCILMPQPTFMLEQPDKLEISTHSSTSSDGGFNINCHGGTGSIDVTVTGGSIGNYSYTWTTTSGSGIINGQEDQGNLTAGSYHLRVSDLNGCIAETDVTLTEPSEMLLVLTPSHITCQSGTYDNGAVDLNVTGGIAPYLYNWSNGENSQDIDNLTEGIYSVSVTDANGCNRNESVIVNLPPPLAFEKVVSAYSNFNISCFGRSDGWIQINPVSGTPPYIYRWEGPDGFTQNTKDISDLKAGEYVLLITDSNFCTGTETIVLNEPPGEISMVITSLDNLECNGDKSGTISLEAVNNAGAVTYLWSDGALGNIRNRLAAGDYKVIITDSNNCRADSVITITQPDSLLVTFETVRPFCTDMPDGEIRLTVMGGTGPGYTYLWSDNSTDKDLTNVPGGLYSVRVTDMNNCYVEKSFVLEPVNSVCLDIPNAISPNGDLINDVWNIGMKELYPQMEIKIFNRWGEIVWKSDKGYPRPWDGRSNGSILPVDSYHYIIDLNNGSKPFIGHITIVK
jgi:gliding motility-associated-like protein